MTTFVNFSPSRVSAFQFQATLDGAQYNCIVTWNLFARRFYLNVYALDGTLVESVPMVGSPAALEIETLSWENGRALAVLAAPHPYPTGSLVKIVVAGCSPDAYNGTVTATVVDRFSLSYALATNPSPATAVGSAAYNISLTAGYFDSTLVYRESSNQFEVNS